MDISSMLAAGGSGLDPILIDIMIVLAAGFIAGAICRRIGISMLIGYLVVGVLISPGLWRSLGLAPIAEDASLKTIANLGVILLLFGIGLELSMDELTKMGKYLVVGGSTQMLLTALPVFGLSLLLGKGYAPAFLIAMAVTFSSTILVFKALAESGQASGPLGRRAIGVLLAQDVALIPLLLILPLIAGKAAAAETATQAADESSLLWQLGSMLVTTLLVIVAIGVVREVVRRFAVPKLLSLRNTTLIVLFVFVMLGFTIWGIDAVGLPIALGAFAAGLLFSDNRATGQVDALIMPFREVFSATFFVSLGMLFEPAIILSEPLIILGGLLAVIAVKTAAAMIALRLTGLGWTCAFGLALGLSQIGEFAFVLMKVGLDAGLIAREDFQRVLIFAIGSLIATPFLLNWGLRRSEKDQRPGYEEVVEEKEDRPDVDNAIIVGIGPIGEGVAERLLAADLDVYMVDLSPVNLYRFAQKGLLTVAGDATDPEVLEKANLSSARVVCICVPDDRVAMRVLGAVRSGNPSTTVLMRCRYRGTKPEALKQGASSVVCEEDETSGAFVELLEHDLMLPMNTQAAGDGHG